MTNDVFLEAFESCTLPAAEWTHEAHLRLAWLLLDQLPYGDALDRIRRGINRFNDTVLKKDMAYHETITVVFTQLIAVGRGGLPAEHTFADFKVACPKLFDRKLSALLRHYRHETLFSPAARAGYVAPDLLPLPGV